MDRCFSPGKKLDSHCLGQRCRGVCARFGEPLRQIPGLLASAPALQKTTYYYREAALRSLLKIIAAASPEKGYRADQWTAQPAFETLRKMAARVFPKI